MSQSYSGAAAVPARGAAIPAPPAPGGTAPSTDEAAIMNILRLLTRARGTGLTPVDRAFVLAAKAMFAELVNVCDALLSGPPKSDAVARPPADATGGGETLPPAAAAPPVAAAPESPAVVPRRRRPITRGGSGMA